MTRRQTPVYGVGRKMRRLSSKMLKHIWYSITGKRSTTWYRWNPKKERWELNHWDDYWSNGVRPIPISKCQRKAWKNAKWRKEIGYSLYSRYLCRLIWYYTDWGHVCYIKSLKELGIKR